MYSKPLKKQLLSLFLMLITVSSVYAQSVSLDYNTLAGTKNQLPFWLWANQLGQYERNSSCIQNLGLNALYQQKSSESDFTIEAGLDLDLLLADNNDIHFTQLFAGFSWKFLQLQIGAFADEECYAGLSISNGNLAAARNARPHPRLRAGFNRFVPLIAKWLYIKGFYEEGLLNDRRTVDNTHLHRKALYLRFGSSKTIEITGGLEHFVMWGGTHPVYGELQGWDSYIDYISGKAGDENSLMTDQLNVLGNGYGVYQLQLKKNWDKIYTSLYVSHPYDDRSGLRLTNHLDNLWGIHLAFQKKNTLISNLVMEFFNTKNQSGRIHLVEGADGKIHGRGRDDYFNHGVYQSGATYHGMSMVSPLFAPITLAEGISKGFESTRYTGFNLGANGSLSQTVEWKSLICYTNNLGKHDGSGGSTLSPARKQVSALGKIYWYPKEKSFNISTSLSADYGSLYDSGTTTTRMGAMLSICYVLR